MVELPSAASAIRVKREWETVKTGESNEHTRYFISSLPVKQAKQTAKKVRTHWAVENKNHYRKDTSLWREDDHRHRRKNTAQNLALMRSALLCVMPFDDEHNLDSLLHRYRDKPHEALKIIRKSRPL